MEDNNISGLYIVCRIGNYIQKLLCNTGHKGCCSLYSWLLKYLSKHKNLELDALSWNPLFLLRIVILKQRQTTTTSKKTKRTTSISLFPVTPISFSVLVRIHSGEMLFNASLYMVLSNFHTTLSFHLDITQWALSSVVNDSLITLKISNSAVEDAGTGYHLQVLWDGYRSFNQ